MAQTKQGTFPSLYCHVNAPTVRDEELWKEKHQYKLIVPAILPQGYEYVDRVFVDPLVGMLSGGKWNIRRKIDGQNIRIFWDGNQALWSGKTDKFSCDAEFTDYMNSTFIEEIFEEKFGHEKEVYIFAEKMGPRTQGNELQLDQEQVIIFDVRINGYWLNRHSVQCVAEYFGVKTVYDYMGPKELETQFTLPELCRMVAQGQFKNWEGAVATPIVECQDQEGHRVIVKVKNKDYYRPEYEDKSITEFIYG